MNKQELKDLLQKGKAAGDTHIADEIMGQGFSACCREAGITEPEEDLEIEDQIKYLKTNAPEWCEETVEANMEALKVYVEELEYTDQ